MSEPPTKQARTDEGDAMEASARQAGGGGQSLQSKETPISIPPTITYGLQDTHTMILPTIFYLSAVNITRNGTACLRLCLNDFDTQQVILDTVTKGGATQAAQTTPFRPSGTPTTAPGTNAIYNFARRSNTLNSDVTTDSFYEFPSKVLSEKIDPYWWNYYNKLYTYYTVLGCEYEITCTNPNDYFAGTEDTAENNILIAKHVESIGGSTQNREFPKNLKTQDLFPLKQLQWIKVNQNIPTEKYTPTIISGYHKTGTVKRDVANDGDVKTWSVIGGTAGAPTNTYKEYLQLDIGRDPMGPRFYETKSYLNMQIRLKYTVQVKQLKTQAMYHQPSITPIAQTVPTDVYMPPAQITLTNP